MRTSLHGSGVQICTSLKVYCDLCMGSVAPAKQVQADQRVHKVCIRALFCNMRDIHNAAIKGHQRKLLKIPKDLR